MVTQRQCGKWVRFALVAAVAGAAPAWGAVVGTGDVVPLDPATWTSATIVRVGTNSSASVVVNSGSVVSSSSSFLGYGFGGSGAVTVDGVGSTWTSSGYFAVGYSSPGSLGITSGGMIYDVSGSIGGSTITPSTATVDGAGSIWSNSGVLYVGISGAGILTVTNGGTVTNASDGYIGNNGVGTATVTGAGSTWINGGDLYVGNSATGILNVTNGGKASSAAGQIGYQANSSGIVLIDGTGSTWTTSGNLYVGDSGSGTLTINHGGKVSSMYTAYIGYSSGAKGTVSVNGPGSLWSNTSSISVGNTGAGTLTISNGGVVSSFDGRLGEYGAGTAVIDGAGSAWINTYGLAVGANGKGTLTVTNGGAVSSTLGLIGAGVGPASGGVATIDGAGSTWTDKNTLSVGHTSAGTLIISSGGKVSSASDGFVGNNSGAVGKVTVGGVGSLWTNAGDLYVGNFGVGSLTINSGAMVHSTSDAFLGYHANATGFVSIDGNGSLWTNDSSVFVGYSGGGTVSISHGASLSSAYARLGFFTGASGAAIIDGGGSTWTTSGPLYVGSSGHGNLGIVNGGSVHSMFGQMGDLFGSSGTATVDGSGSTWINSGSLNVGSGGQATLIITGGGSVMASFTSINSASLLTMNVGDASHMDIGTGTVSNNGNIRLRAVAGAGPGSYSPITAANWSGTGQVTALGGKWNSTTHVFTVTGAISGAAGLQVGIDPSVTQRVAISAAAVNRSVWLGFPGTNSPSNIAVTGQPISTEQVEALQSQLAAQVGVLDGWNFTTSGYANGTAVALSIEVGGGDTTDLLAVWRYDGVAWSPYAAGDLSYDGKYANFTVTSLQGYAVTAPLVVCSWGGANGNWSESSSWSPQLPAGSRYNAVVNGGTVALDIDASVRTLALGGGTLTGGHNFVISNGGTVSGGTYNVTGTTTISGGSLVMQGGSHNAGAFMGAGSLVVGAGAVLTSDAVTVAKLVINGTHLLRENSVGLSKVSTLTISAGGSWDVTNHDVMVGNASLGTIEAQILRGFWGKGGNVGDAAITSSTAVAGGKTFVVPIDADVMLGNGAAGSAIGMSFDGVAITQPHTVLLKYTYVGDVTLDGQVNALDMATMAGWFGQSTPGLGDIQTAWLMGDFNFDGVVDGGDFGAMGANAGLAVGAVYPLALRVVSVPEVSTVGMLGMGVMGLLGRRRRRKRIKDKG